MKRTFKNWIKGLLVIALAAPLAATGAAALPAATFFEQLSYPVERLEGDTANPEVIAALVSEDWRSVDAAASTFGGARPTVRTRMALSVNAPGFEQTYRGSAYGAIRYYWSLEQIGGEPFVGLVPVDISTAGSVQYLGSSGRAGVDDVRVNVDFTEMGSGQGRNFMVRPPLDDVGLPIVGTADLDEFYTAMIEPGNRNRVDLSATITGWITTTGSFAAEAWVDPRIVINTEFARRDDFQLVFSAGVTPVPVPASGLLLASALALVAGARHRCLAQGREGLA